MCVWRGGGDSGSNKRGDDLLENILYYNLYIVNNGNKPTFVVKNRSEFIDLCVILHALITSLVGRYQRI